MVVFGASSIGWLNLALVWLFVHQLGFFYADGRLGAWSKGRLASLAVAGLAGMAALTNVGPYPRSMVGVDHEAISNLSPPTLCIPFLALWQIGLAMLARPAVTSWLQGRRAWSAVIAGNGVIMTTFRWHLSALLIAIAALERLGLAPEPDTNAAWWLTRPVWILVPLLVTASIAEHRRLVRTNALPGDRSCAKAAMGGRASSPSVRSCGRLAGGVEADLGAAAGVLVVAGP